MIARNEDAVKFGDILDVITRRSTSMIIEGREVEARKELGKFVRYVKLKMPIQTQFHLYNNIREARLTSKEEATLFLNEALSLLSTVSKTDIDYYNELLCTKFDITEVERRQPRNVINKKIDILVDGILSEATFNTMEKTKAYTFIIEHILREDEEVVQAVSAFETYDGLVSKDIIIKSAINTFNNTYGELTVEDRKVFTILNRDNKTVILKEYKELLLSIDALIETSEVALDLKEKILEASTKLKRHAMNGKKIPYTVFLDAFALQTELERLDNE